jgi:hypothetical protein
MSQKMSKHVSWKVSLFLLVNNMELHDMFLDCLNLGNKFANKGLKSIKLT